MKSMLLAALAGALSCVAGCGSGVAPQDDQDEGTTATRALAQPVVMQAASESWTPLAAEWQTFTLAALSTVRYGSGDTWVERQLR